MDIPLRPTVVRGETLLNTFSCLEIPRYGLTLDIKAVND